MYDFESYCSVPIFLANGDYFGNVCALDKAPLPLRERKAEEMMTLFAQLSGLQLDADAVSLKHAETAKLREQFIAVLGRDLRNPIGAIMKGADLLLERGLGEAEQKIVKRIASSGRRMTDISPAELKATLRGDRGSSRPASIEPACECDDAWRSLLADRRHRRGSG